MFVDSCLSYLSIYYTFSVLGLQNGLEDLVSLWYGISKLYNNSWTQILVFIIIFKNR